jgi:hypothetical protein
MNQNITTIPESNLYVPNASKEDFKLDDIIKMPENKLLIAKNVPRGSIIMPGSDGSYQLNFAEKESSQTKNKITPEKTFFGKQGKLIVLDGKRYKANKVKGLKKVVDITSHIPNNLGRGAVAATAGLATIFGAGIGCSKAGPTPIAQVNLHVEFYNHTQGLITTTTYIGNKGDPLAIPVSSVQAADVDPMHIIVRNKDKLITSERDGEANFNFPNQSQTYYVYLLNTSNNAPYSAIDEWIDKGGGTLEFGHHPTYHYEDKNGYTGNRGVIDAVVGGMNDALTFPWGNYGSLRRVDNGNFGAGFGYCNGWLGEHTATWAGVNNKRVTSYSGQMRIMNAEVFEILTRTDNLQGRPTHFLITDPDGSLNPVGRDLLAYCFIKE